MAKPINETPVLKGKDAKNFLREMENSKTQKASATEMARIKENYGKLKAIAKF